MEQNNGKAIASLVLGIISCAAVFFGYGVFVGLACGIVAIIIGVKARKECPSGMATAGFVLGIIGTVVCSLVFLSCACVFGSIFHSIGSGGFNYY